MAPWTPPTVALLAVALLATACGGGRGDSGAATTAPGPALTSSRAATTGAATPAPTAAPATTAPMTAPSTTTTAPAPPPPVAGLADLPLALEPVADLREPTALAWRDGDPGLYVTTQRGTVWRVDPDGGEPSPVLDLTAEVSEVLEGSERGLLGIAFDPVDGRMFLHFTDRAGDSHVVSFEVRDGVADPATRREVLRQDQPGPGHNGGHLLFDAAGHLYVGLGDGGGSNGRDAQDMTTLLGAILRITPRRDGPGYDVPADNPFAGRADVAPELWVKGFRNPWKFSLDDATGNLWIGDVGNSEIEEIDVLPAGEKGWNFGWYHFEGSKQRYRTVPEGMVAPVHEYTHEQGSAVMGGYVYRGTAIAPLRGAYVFGDVLGTIWALGADGVVELDVGVDGYLTGFGEGPDDELYVLSLFDGVYRLRPG